MAQHEKSGETVISDAPTDNHGKGAAFSPTDLMATSLASCMLTVMGIKAEQKEWNFEGARAETTKVMASNPRRIAEILIDFYYPDSQEWNADQRKLLEKIAWNCPVAKSLHPDLKVQINFF